MPVNALNQALAFWRLQPDARLLPVQAQQPVHALVLVAQKGEQTPRAVQSCCAVVDHGTLLGAGLAVSWDMNAGQSGAGNTHFLPENATGWCRARGGNKKKVRQADSAPTGGSVWRRLPVRVRSHQRCGRHAMQQDRQRQADLIEAIGAIDQAEKGRWRVGISHHRACRSNMFACGCCSQ